MTHRSQIVALTLIVTLTAATARAYNPPVDTAGPLTVRIVGPETVEQAAAPLAVRVLFENKGPQPIAGSVQLGLVDAWQAAPAGPAKFSVPAGGKAEQAFTVTVGPHSYSAHYPIHAFARFDWDGQPHVAHPILICETKLPLLPRDLPRPEWKPFPAAADRELTLWRLPTRRAVIEVFGKAPQVMPVGWEGSEPQTRATLRGESPQLAGQKREAIGIHPPWFQGRAGTMLVEYPLALPNCKPLTLRFATAMTPDGKGDGVTFRVRVAAFDAPAGEFGHVVFERHSNAKQWLDGEADLSAYAGQSVRVQLESHPGPKHDTSFDHSFWAEPTLVAGHPPAPPAFPPKSDDGSQPLGKCGPNAIRLWLGQRGLLDAVIAVGDGPRRLYLRGFEVRTLGQQIDDGRGPILLREARTEPCDGGCQVRHRFSSAAGDFDLLGRAAVADGALRVRFWLENLPAPKPWQTLHLEDVAVAAYSRTATQVYAGHGNVLRNPEGFSLGFDGHRLATSFVGFDFDGGPSLLQATDFPPERLEVRPERKHYSLHAPHGATFTFVPADDVWAAVRQWRGVNGLTAAGGVPKLAGRFVFDLWGGRYGESADALQKAFGYGLTDACVVWHNWQRWGYDYRLPDIMPPNPQLGTTAELRRMSDLCREHGVLFGPHDNYIDFYPDAEGFSYEKQIAFSAGGQPVKAWINEHRGARSYRFRADTLAPLVHRNLAAVKAALAPSAYFIDVWSSAGPYDYWTADGRYVDRVFTRNTWGETFAWIRRMLGDDAPQISESGHDQLIGWLDGGQTNHLRVGPPTTGHHAWCVWNVQCADAERIPWLDAAHHDRFVLHGAGYPGRYEAGLDPRLHGIYSDDYIATEVLDGHPAMVSQPFGRDVVRKYWLLHELMRALALRQIESVEFAGGDLHRQHVAWSGGGDVWVNRGATDWQVAGHTLPPYGFCAHVETAAGPVTAAIERRAGLIVEQVISPQELYVNGRQMSDGLWRAALAVEKAKWTGPRHVELQLAWQLDDALPDDYAPFLHFCDAQGEIVFQGSLRGGPLRGKLGTVAATATADLPGDAKPGQAFELRYGFYRPHGRRLALAGPDDGTQRVRVGTLKVEGEGGKVGGVSWTRTAPTADEYLTRHNPEGKPVDFGGVVTAAGLRLTRDGESLRLTPLPSTRGPKQQVVLRPAKLPWKLSGLTHVEQLDDAGRATARQPLARRGDDLELDIAPGVFAYRLLRQE